MSVLFTTVYSGIALNTDLTKGVVDRFRSLPIWRPAPLVGSLLGDSVRYVLAGTVIIVLGVILGYRPGGRRRRGRSRRWRWWSSSPSASPGCSRRSGLLLRSPNAVMNAGFMGDLPADLPLQRLRRARDAARRARGLRRRQPDLDPGRRLAAGLMEGNADGSDIVDRARRRGRCLTAVFAPLTTASTARG